MVDREFISRAFNMRVVAEVRDLTISKGNLIRQTSNKTMAIALTMLKINILSKPMARKMPMVKSSTREK